MSKRHKRRNLKVQIASGIYPAKWRQDAKFDMPPQEKPFRYVLAIMEDGKRLHRAEVWNTKEDAMRELQRAVSDYRKQGFHMNSYDDKQFWTDDNDGCSVQILVLN